MAATATTTTTTTTGPFPSDPSETTATAPTTTTTTTTTGELMSASSAVAPVVSETAVASAFAQFQGLTEDTAETAAAAAALVVDSVVEGTVAAVITNNKLASSSLVASTTGVVYPDATTYTDATPGHPMGTVAPTTTTLSSSAESEQPTSNRELPQQPQQTQQPQTQTPLGIKTTQDEISIEIDNGNPALTLTAAPMVQTTTTTYPANNNTQQKSKRKERLEQNRISARESRKRKKSMIEELQRTVITLTAENKELNGRNQSLRSNLAGIGLKYPNSASIRAILNGVPTPSPQQQQPPPTQSPMTNPSAVIEIGGQVIAASNFLQLSQQAQLIPNAVQNVVPILANTNHTMNVPPAMVVPYMYIPQPAHNAPGGMMQIAAPRRPGQPMVVQAANCAGSPLPGAISAVMGPQQQQQHISIAPQPKPPTMAQHQQEHIGQILVRPQTSILPAPAAQVSTLSEPSPVAPSAALTSPMMEPVPNPMATAAAAAESMQITNNQESVTLV